jgi:hypothetical protein
MSLFSDPLLAVWEAMNLLSKVDLDPDAPQIRALVTDAEAVLCRLTMELARRQIPPNVNMHHGINKIVPINCRFTVSRARKTET